MCVHMESSPIRPLKLEGFFIPYQETYKCYDHVLPLLILDFFKEDTMPNITWSYEKEGTNLALGFAQSTINMFLLSGLL